MKFLSIFDVIGPNMIGPSSSHTAGACAIGLMTRKMLGEAPAEITFTLYGSFAKTYHGHGTDRALLGGMLGFSPDDERIRDAFDIANQYGVKFTFVPDDKTETSHPNTADIFVTSISGHTLKVRGESIGGGKINIAAINDIEVDFTGEYSTVIIRQGDVPGIVANITKALAAHKINIAFLRMYRDEQGKAYTIIEADEPITPQVIDTIKTIDHVYDVKLIEM